MLTDSLVAGMAFSTGITCMPMPLPPGGTRGVILVSGRNAMRSKELCDLRVLLDLVEMHVHKLGSAGNEDRAEHTDGCRREYRSYTPERPCVARASMISWT